MTKTKKTIKTIFTLIFLVFILIIPYFVFAQSPLDAVKNVADAGSGYDTSTDATDVPKYLGSIISVFMGLLGVVFVVLMIYGGFNWMRAGGDEAKVTLAVNTIRRAIIGLLITVGSYAIVQFVLLKILF